MDKLHRITVLAVGLVGLAAMLLSFRHQMILATSHGETARSAWLVPVTADGAIIAGTIALLDAARKGASARWARLTTGAGISLSVLLNVVHGASWGWLGVIIAGWPPVALVLAVETLAAMIRRRKSSRDVEGAFDHGNVTGDRSDNITSITERDESSPSEQTVQIAQFTQSVAEPSPGLDPNSSNSSNAPVPEPVDEADEYPAASNGHSADAHLVMRECSGDAVPSLREIQRILSCGQTRAQRVQGECREMRTLAAEMR